MESRTGGGGGGGEGNWRVCREILSQSIIVIPFIIFYRCNMVRCMLFGVCVVITLDSISQ